MSEFEEGKEQNCAQHNQIKVKTKLIHAEDNEIMIRNAFSTEGGKVCEQELNIFTIGSRKERSTREQLCHDTTDTPNVHRHVVVHPI